MQFVVQLCNFSCSYAAHTHPRTHARMHTHTHNRVTAFFVGPPACASARRELLDFMVQGKTNRGRTQTIRLGATPSGLTIANLHHAPIFFTRWMPFLPPNQWCQSTEGN